MIDEMTAVGVPEVISRGGGIDLPPAVEGQFSGHREDFEKDMALLAKEMGQTEAPITPLVVESAEPKQPEQPQAQAPVTAEQPKAEEAVVPDKFKTPDGKPDYDKLVKSFLEAEKALKREQNKNRQAPIAPAQPESMMAQVGQSQEPAQPHADPFVNQVEQDIRSIGLAATLVKLAEAQHQATVRETVGRVSNIEEFAQEQAMAAELKEIVARSPEIMSPKGLEELKRIRAENPEIKSWKKAYVHYLGEKQFNNVAGASPVLPTPKAVTAPIVPVTAGIRPTTAANGVPVSGAELDRLLDGLTPAQENAFWAKNVQGAKPIHRGIK